VGAIQGGTRHEGRTRAESEERRKRGGDRKTPPVVGKWYCHGLKEGKFGRGGGGKGMRGKKEKEWRAGDACA